ncbi:MAG TPA: hypothetical protein VIU64_14835 [Polyangia bacterium]
MQSSRRLSLRFALVLATGLSLAGLDEASAVGPHDRHLTSLRHGLSVEAPAGWTLSQHTGYGDTVVLLLHPDGSRISVSAAPTTAPDPAALFDQNRKGLVAQKLSPSAPQRGPRGFLAVDIAAPDRPERLRQLYFVRPTGQGKQAIILTLIARAAAFSVHTAALDFVANRLTFDEPTPPGGSSKLSGPAVPKLTPPEGASAGGGEAGGGSGGQVRPDDR